MATEFEQLLKEQKLTNKLLVEQAAADAKPASLVRSVRDNLGEILDNRRLAKQEEKFQQKEGIVKVDENVAAGTKEVITQSDFFKEQIESLGEQDTLLTRQDKLLLKQSAGINGMVAGIREMIAISQFLLENSEIDLTKDDHTTKMFMRFHREDMNNNAISAAMQRGLLTNFKTETPSIKKAKEKKEAANEKKSQGFLKSLNEQFKGISGFLRSNKFVQGVGSFLGKALLLTGLIAFVKFISSPKFIEFAAFLDKTVMPVLGKIFDVLKGVGAKALDIVAKLGGNILDPDQDMMTKFTSGVLLAAIGVAALFSKSILAFIGTKALAGLLTLAPAIKMAAIFNPIGLIITGFIAAIAGAIVGLVKGKKTFEQARAEGDNVALALTKATGTFVANLIGLLPDLLIKAIGSLVSIFDKDLGAKIKSFSFSGLLEDILKGVGNLIKNAFFGFFELLGSGFKKLFLGKDTADLTEEIERLEGKLKTEKRTTVKEGLRRRITELKEKRKEAMETGGRVGGLLGSGGEISDESLIMSQPNYRGGRVRRGQSIMVGEAGPELFIPTTDAQVFSARRTEEMIMSALARGMSGGGEGGSTIITSDNSVRSNSSTTNVVNETITPLDTITTSVISSV